MSAIEENGKSRAARAFFLQVLVPLADRLRAERRSFFARRPERGRESYFTSAAPPNSPQRDLVSAAPCSPEEFAAQLAALWRAEGDSELADLMPEIHDLAEQLREGEEQTEDVSPFLYVMY